MADVVAEVSDRGTRRRGGKPAAQTGRKGLRTRAVAGVTVSPAIVACASEACRRDFALAAAVRSDHAG
jgi:hypothetical protein